jgi:hypothetical protein
MPAYCHDDRPPLFASSPDDLEIGRQRLPNPSSPPWVNCSTPPAEFYRPIFCGADHRPRLAFVGAVQLMAPKAQSEGEP